MHYPHFLHFRKPSRLATTLCVVAAILAILLAVGMPAIERQLSTWGVLPRQEQLTQLYFTDPSALPKTYSVGQPLMVNITVQNGQDHAARYTYTASEAGQTAGQSQKLKTGTFTLQAGEARHMTLQITPSDLGHRVYLSVSLSASEHIGYWVEQK